MNASHIMTSPVISVEVNTPIRDVARVLLKQRISAVPVMDEDRHLAGIVSEGDLVRHASAGTEFEPHQSWWLALLATPASQVDNFARTHGDVARQVMSRDVVTVTEDATLPQIAALLEEHRIKRVPVIGDGRLVGIVSRANLLHGLAASEVAPYGSPDDVVLRAAVDKAIDKAEIKLTFGNTVVTDGIGHLWGAVDSEETRTRLTLAVEEVEGLRSVVNHVSVLPLVLLA